MKINKCLIAFGLALTMMMVSGCSMFGSLKPINLNDVTVKNVSVVNGITVDVKGTECTFNFTADRNQIFEEIKTCLLEHAMAHATAVPIPVGFTAMVNKPPDLDPQTIQEVEKATLEVLKQIED